MSRRAVTVSLSTIWWAMATSSPGMVAGIPAAQSSRSASGMVHASSSPMPRTFVERTRADRREPWQSGQVRTVMNRPRRSRPFSEFAPDMASVTAATALR